MKSGAGDVRRKYNIGCIIEYLLCLWCVLAGSAAGELVFTAQPASTAVLPGQSLMLDCHALDIPLGRDLSYQWEFEGLPVFESLPQASFFPNHSLYISAVDASAMGVYQCTVWLTVRPQERLESETASVVEAYLEDFYLHPENQSVQVGSTATLTCVTGLGAPPPLLSWEKDGLAFLDGQKEYGVFGNKGPGGAMQSSAQLKLVGQEGVDGAYRCVAANPLSGDVVRSLAATVVIIVPRRAPFISDIVPGGLVMTAGAPYTIECPISGEPLPNVTWFKDGATVNETAHTFVTSDGSLHFETVEKADAGLYHCQGSNSLGSVATPDIEVTVAYLDLFFLAEPQSSSATAGQELTLTCDPPDSHPPAKVIWYKDDVAFQGRTGALPVTIWSNGDLFFHSIQLMDQGQYFCVALNEEAGPKSVRSNVATVTVYGSPVILTPPTPTKVIKGQTLYLTCNVNANPVATTTWLKDGVQLQGTTRIKFWRSGQDVTITDIHQSDQGNYRCRSSNNYGTVHSGAVFVTVIVPPEITLPPSDQTVVAGDDVLLQCEAYGNPEPAITWYREEESVAFDERIRQQQDGLSVAAVRKSDEGHYTCSASNEGGSRHATAELRVMVGPRLIGYPSDTTVNRSDSVVLYCQATGDPVPTLDWLFNDSSELPAGSKLTEDKSTLIISSAQPHQTGKYACVATNSAGSAEKTVDVFVQVKPMVAAIEGRIHINQGDDLDLICKAAGIPQPTVSWYNGGQLVRATSDTRISFPTENAISVKFVTRADEGKYRCVASNVAGVDTGDVIVQIRGTPLPPYFHAAVPVSTSSVNLSWVPNRDDPRAEVNSYTIQYKESRSAEFQTYRDDVPAPSTWSEVHGLQPATRYAFQVAARNDIGLGRFSAVLAVTTLETAPSAVRSLQLLTSAATYVELQWEIPAQPNGLIRIYQLWYKPRFAQDEFLQVDIDTPSLPLQAYTLQGLAPYTTYTLRVRAATIEAGQQLWGDFSQSLDVTTTATAPSVSPGDVYLSVTSSSVIHVQWSPLPENKVNGELRGYHVLYKVTDSQTAPSLIFTDVVATETSISGLLPWRYYDVQVTAFNNMGAGPPSPRQQVRTMAEAPSGAPTGIRVQPIAATAIQVTWQPVPLEERNSEISGYLVNYWIEETDFDRSQYIGNPDTLQVEIRGLEPWTQYQVQIQAFTTQVSAGFGPLSAVHTTRTLETYPGPVGNLEVTVEGPQSLTVTWKEPDKANGIIQSYVILHQAIGTVAMETTWLANQDELEESRGQVSGSTVMPSRVSTSIASADSTKYTLLGLEASTVYYIGVAAQTWVGQGPLVNATATTDSAVTLPNTATFSSIMTQSLTSDLTQSEMTSTPATSDEAADGLSQEALVGIVVGATVVGVLLLLLVLLAFVVCCRHQRKVPKAPSQYLASASYSTSTSGTGHSSKHGVPPTAAAPHVPQAVQSRGDFTELEAKVQHEVSVGAHGATGTERALSSTNATYNGTPSLRGSQGGTGRMQVMPSGGGHHRAASQNVLSQDVEIHSPVSNGHAAAPVQPRDTLPSLQHLFARPAGGGTVNPAYESETAEGLSRAGTTGLSTSSVPPVYRNSRDFYSQVHVSKRRQNRMDRASASAIAAQRNIASSVFDDTQLLIQNDSVVVYDERTAL